MKEVKWSDDLYVDAYDYSRSGAGNVEIAKALGVTYKTFKRWMRSKPAFRNAILRGRKLKEGKSGNQEYREYVYERLPSDLKELWEEINKCETQGNPIEHIEALLEGKGKRVRQHLYLYALVHYNFNPSDAMKAVCITRQTVERWAASEPKFALLLDEIHYHKKNFFEGQLVKLAKAGETSAILHGNKVYNSDRGHNTKTTIAHEHSGDINHTHKAIPIDDLGLDLEHRKKILQAIRERKLAAITYSPHEEVVEDAEFTVKKRSKGKRKG